ncbi:ABC-2 transporter permease [Butyrivibrio sp. INlla16]|uniref:ABC-2 transporter permease n=1 Tax=Butyrivibrio sp. INlla16 TaxID=1520807 RepID=UPI00088DBF19|nr:ABC-2 transporter permease [Butyrivibrio sp. INlla16]SDB11346.1 ABC-2 family transporter protein [Butyrivibrio sp. INlla16]
MRGLIEKDLRLTLVRKQTLIIFLVMAIVMGLSNNGAFLIAYLTMLALVVGTGSISYDEYDNGFPFLMTLPFDRKTYVREKYVFSLIAAVAAWCFGALVFAVMDMVRNNGAGLSEIPMMTAVIPSMYLATAIIVPLQLKFGAEKSRIALFVIFGIVAVLAIGSSSFLADSVNPFVSVINILHDLPGAVTILILIAVCALVTAISYLCSVRIMENKEF